MTEMPSKRRSGNRPTQDRTDTRDTRKTIGPYIYRFKLPWPNFRGQQSQGLETVRSSVIKNLLNATG